MRVPHKILALAVLLIAAAQSVFIFVDFDLGVALGYEAFVLAIAALMLALEHSSTLRRVTGQLQDVASKLEGVADDQLDSVARELESVAQSVPTRGIGVFPEYLSEVAGLVGRATKSIQILCDTPAHGAFSNTDAFSEYWSRLRHKVVDDNIEIKCAFFDASGREQLHYAQIAEDRGSWQSWQERNQRNCEAFDDLAQKSKLPRPDGDSATEIWAAEPDTYVASMMTINRTVLSTFNHGAEIEQIPYEDPLHDGPSVYFWLRDEDQEAVFVIVPVRGIGVKELAGFHTREPALIRALSTVYDHRGKGG